MQRLFKVKIGDKEYPICYSLRVLKAISDEYGSPDKAFAEIDNPSAVKAMEAQVFILHKLILAGAKVSSAAGEEGPQVLSLTETRIMANLTMPGTIKKIVKSTVALSSIPSIEAEPAKGKSKRTMRSFESYLWQGLHLGLDYDTAMDIPFGELLSLIGEESIQNGAKEKIRNMRDIEDAIPDWE